MAKVTVYRWAKYDIRRCESEVPPLGYTRSD